MTTTDPFSRPSQLPHGAFPFDQLKKEFYVPALDRAIGIAKANLDKIRNAKDEATFENTILALETASEDVGRVSTVFFNQLGANSDDELQLMAREISPKLAEFSSDVTLDSKIFARVKAVWENRTKLGLKGEELRLTEKTYKDFARNGGLLDDATKQKLREIDQQLSKLGPEFSDNVLKATNDFKMWLDKKEDLDGLPESTIEAYAIAAKDAQEVKNGASEEDKRNHAGASWLVTLHGPSLTAFMTYSSRRDLREKLSRASGSKAFRDSHDNEKITIDIVKLRHDRAKLLGYKSHADFVLEERMAEKPEKVISFLERILEKSTPAGKRDIEQVRALKKEMTGDADFQPWDYAYYSEKLKMKLHNLDQEQLRPYFKLENVVEGVFEHAKRLYGLQFKENKTIPVYHPDVRVFEVTDTVNGNFVGLFYADFFPRPSKRGGAWMTSYREQGFQGGKVERPHVSIVCSFTKPTPTKPSLLTFEEVRTLFHEFGHSLHGLLSNVKYVSLGGTNVFWDFVELPSQIMENWALEKEALDLFAVHYETGEKIPKELTDKIRAASNFQAGYFGMRQVQFGLLDMAWHAADPSAITDVDAFERKVTERTALLPKVPGTNMSCSFSHIFAGGYSAGYYSYKWAEVLDADAFELFKERGLFHAETARAFKENILSQGGTQHPMELYKKFRGREPDPDALLRRDGLIESNVKAGTV